MKKIMMIMAISLCMIIGACGHEKVDKEALMNKLNSHPSELTTEDYSNLLYVLEDNLNQLDQLRDKAPEEMSKEDMDLVSESLLIAIMVDGAIQKGDLDKSNLKKFEKLKSKMQNRK